MGSIARDDEDIARLERKLGIKKKSQKAPGDKEDGLDALLGDLDESEALIPDKKRKTVGDDDWLLQKRRKVIPGAENEDSDTDFNGFSDPGDDDIDTDDFNDDDGSDDADYPEEDKDAGTPARPPKENPYRAPGTTQDATAKYIPPSMRQSQDDQGYARLRRQIQGQTNRLSESNMPSILSAVEAQYQSNPRQHVTSALLDTLLALIADGDQLSDLFITLHGGFVAALYRVVGVDFGAQLLERVVADLDTPLDGKAVPNKKRANLMSLLSVMYNFEIITCRIIYDLVRELCDRFSEDDTDLLLRIIRTCGTQLRRDDPSALKDVIYAVQKKAGELGEGTLSVRQSFMIETMTDLKNNKMKAGAATTAARTEAMARMKKQLGSIKSRSTRASEPLTVSLDDIRSSEKKGKWWLVGASYHDPAKMVDQAPASKIEDKMASSNGAITVKDDLADVARALGMNTEIRKAIFTSIMTAADFKEATMKLKKLRLKKAQQEEIPNVLIRCTLGEDAYNPYYTALARDSCQERAVKWAFQTNLWDYLKRMKDDDGDEDANEADELDVRKIVSLGKMYGALIRSDAVPITVLKKVDFAYLQSKTQIFLEVALTTAILDKTPGPSIEELFCRIREVPDTVSGFRYFLQTVLARSEVPEKKRHRKRVAEVCATVVEMLSSTEVVV